MNQDNGPCHGIRVVEFATMISGPFGGQFLGDLGADIIKVEPLTGDPLRAIRPMHDGMSAMFMNFNRNKKSIAVDLKSEQGCDIARQLVGQADVVLENNRNGVMQRLGLDYEAVAASNARLIYLSITGFGVDGPYSERPAYEHLLQAYSGMMRIQGGAGIPTGIENVVVDKSSALLAANAILAALFHRERTGKGQRITLSLMSAAAAFLLPEQISNSTFAGSPHDQVNASTFHPVETADGFVVGYLQQRTHFIALCHTFGRDDLIDDPRFQTPWGIYANLATIWREMQTVARQYSTAYLVETAAAHGMPLAPVNSIAGFLENPQAHHGGLFPIIDDERLGAVRQIRYPAELHASPATIRRLAPRLGEHTAEILEMLGYSKERQSSLAQERLVA